MILPRLAVLLLVLLTEALSSKISLLHMHDSATFFSRLGALTLSNKARYASRHNYDVVSVTPSGARGLYKPSACPPSAPPPCWAPDTSFVIDAGRAATFGKLKLARAACNNRADGWLLWSDADAMVVNQTYALENLIDDGYDVMVAYDWLMLQAGVILFKCSPFTLGFLDRVYGDRHFDKARALDQSALEHYINLLSKEERARHVKILPKHAFNVYLEEYRPGDFLIHMAGKLYEATEPGLWAIANQFDILSIAEDVEDIEAFFSTRYLLNQFSGVCPVDKAKGERQSSCKPEDPRRFRLKESLGSMSTPNRYRHVGMRYYFLQNWTDKYDVPGWNTKRKELAPASSAGTNASGDNAPAVVPPVFAHPEASAKAAELEPAPAKPQEPPTIEIVLDNSPPHLDSKGRDSGAKIPPPKTITRGRQLAARLTAPSEARTWIFLPLVVAVFFGCVYLLYTRRVSRSLKQR